MVKKEPIKCPTCGLYRGGSSDVTAVKKANREARDQHVERGRRSAELKAEGLTWAQVAEQLGYGSPSAAARAAQRHGEVDWTAR